MKKEAVDSRLAEWYLPLGFLQARLSHQFKTYVATGRHIACQLGILWGQFTIHASPGLSPPLGYSIGRLRRTF